MARNTKRKSALGRARFPCMSLFFIGFAMGVPSAFGQVVNCDADFAPGRVLVRFKPTATAGAQQSAHTSAGAIQILREFHTVSGLQLVEVQVGQEQAAITAYQNDAGIEYAEPDYLVRLDRTPNEVDFGNLWGLHNYGQTVNGDQSTHPDADIDAREAWDFWQAAIRGHHTNFVDDEGPVAWLTSHGHA